MGKFDNVKKMDKDVAAAVKKSNEVARVPYYAVISNADIIDNPLNNENMTDLADIENSIEEIGFTDPLELTKLENGKYMLLSGHRRRLAGINKGLDAFPSIVIPMKNKNELHNYLLLSNNHRDSSKDPLLYCKRYKMHEAYLDAIGFKGAKRDEIAKRLGISIAQADRYNRFNNIIAPIWELVRDERVGMSSVLPMYNLTPDDQEAIASIFLEMLETEERISREKCELIIKEFKTGKKPENILSGATAENINISEKNEISAVDAGEQEQYENNILNNYPSADNIEDGEEFLKTAGADADIIFSETPPENNEVEMTIENEVNGDMPNKAIPRETLTKDERQRQRGLKIGKNLEKLSSSINKGYEFADKETAQMTLKSMSEFITLMFSEIQDMAEEYGMQEIFDALKTELKNLLG